MGITGTTITAGNLKEYLWQVELPRRLTGMFGSEAEVIIRRGSFVGSTIDQFASLSRTMVHAREHVFSEEAEGNSVASGTVFLAEYLTGSKGRFTRQWHAPEGGLWGSMIYVNTLLSTSRLLLPIAIGIACCEAIRESGAHNASIRWINDVLLSGKKVAGFLLEGFHGKVSGEEYTLAGFGINVNNTEFPEELKDTAISLREYLGKRIDRERFTYDFFAKLSWNLGLLVFEEDTYLQEERWSGRSGRHALIERWCELSDSVGRRVQFGFDVMNAPQFEATVTGMSDNGGLLLTLDDNSKIVEHSGEIRYCD